MTRRTLLGIPQPYEKLAVKQETDILLKCPICNIRRVQFECFIMSCPMHDSHKFYCGKCPESEHTKECHFDLMLNELSMSMAAGYRRKQLVVAEIALKEAREKLGTSTRLLTEVEEKMEERKLHSGRSDYMNHHRPESDSRALSEGDVSET
jgi:hypothetical protein